METIYHAAKNTEARRKVCAGPKSRDRSDVGLDELIVVDALPVSRRSSIRAACHARHVKHLSHLACPRHGEGPDPNAPPHHAGFDFRSGFLAKVAVSAQLCVFLEPFEHPVRHLHPNLQC